MKDKFKDGAFYLTPWNDEMVVAKASVDCSKRLNFFFCDAEGFLDWEKVDIAYRVKITAPLHIEMMGE